VTASANQEQADRARRGGLRAGLLASVLVGLVTIGAAASAGAIARQADNTGILRVEKRVSDYPEVAVSDLPAAWDFELTSSQPGCTNTTFSIDLGELVLFGSGDLLAVQDTAIEMPVAELADDGTACDYTLAEINLPDGWSTPGDRVFELENGVAIAYFLNSKTVVPQIAIYVEKFLHDPLGDLPATWDFELTSTQEGCTNATISIDAGNVEVVNGSFYPVRKLDDLADPCTYQVTEINLPSGWVQPPAQQAVINDAGGFVVFENARTGAPTTPRTATIEIRKFVPDGQVDVPPGWDFELTSSQPGCTNTVLSIPSGGFVVEGSTEVVWRDTLGAPCTYLIAETNLPPGWVQSSGFDLPNTLTIYRQDNSISVVNRNPNSPGVIRLTKRVYGSDEGRPAEWDFELTSPQAGCTNTAFSFDSNTTISAAQLDSAGEPCQYTLAEVNLPAGWVQPGDQVFELRGGTASLDIDNRRRDSPFALSIEKIVTTAFDEQPALWEFEISSSQPGCTQATVTNPPDPGPLPGEMSRVYVYDIASVDDAGDLCIYQVAEINVPPGWIQPEPQTVISPPLLYGDLIFSNIRIESLARTYTGGAIASVSDPSGVTTVTGLLSNDFVGDITISSASGLVLFEGPVPGDAVSVPGNPGDVGREVVTVEGTDVDGAAIVATTVNTATNAGPAMRGPTTSTTSTLGSLARRPPTIPSPALDSTAPVTNAAPALALTGHDASELIIVGVSVITLG